jgi:hypothetical protein
MQVRRKSLHRSLNNKRAKKFANMRAAKERKRLERLASEDVVPDMSHVWTPKALLPLFTVTIRCRDGASASLRIHEGAWGGLSISPTLAGRKVACVLANYRPA